MTNYSSRAVPTTLVAAISGSHTTIQVASTAGYPSAPFNIIVDEGNTPEEIMRVTAKSGSTWTVLRGRDGSAAVPHASGAPVRHGITGGDLQAASDHIDATVGVHGVSGAIAGVSDAQTLTNKTVAFASNTLTGVASTGTAQTLTNKVLSGSDNTFSNIPQSAVTGLPSRLTVIENDIDDLAGDISDLQSDVDDKYEKPYIRRKGNDSDATNMGVTVGFPTSLTLDTNRGNWTGGLSLNQNQFRVPVSGMYSIKATASWNRTDPGQTGFVRFQFRRGMSANNADSGTIVLQNYYNIVGDASTPGQINDTLYLQTGTTYGFTLMNETTGSIQRRYEEERGHYSVMFETPVGAVA